jgi:hypothetical protein
MPGIPEDARLLIATRVDSLATLDVLGLVRTGGDREWTADDVAGALRLDVVSASRQLVALRQGGILTVTMGVDARYRYAPPAATAVAIDALVAAYVAHPLEVAELIAARPRNKLRLFADAFRIRKDG